MAFEFPHRDPTRLFFPTVHVHDGRVHARAEFDHALYCQLTPSRATAHGWERSRMLASGFVDVDRAAGLVDGDAHCLRRTIRGLAPNQDTWL